MAPIRSAFRPVLTLALALALAFVSVLSAAARADARATMAMELCIDHRIAVVVLDARGNPVDHRLCCLDCMAGGPGLTDPAAPPQTAPARLSSRIARARAALAPAARHRPGTPPARGPPAGA